MWQGQSEARVAHGIGGNLFLPTLHCPDAIEVGHGAHRLQDDALPGGAAIDRAGRHIGGAVPAGGLDAAGAGLGAGADQIGGQQVSTLIVGGDIEAPKVVSVPL